MAIQPPAASLSEQVAEASRVASTDPTKAEELYRGVLSQQSGQSTVPATTTFGEHVLLAGSS